MQLRKLAFLLMFPCMVGAQVNNPTTSAAPSGAAGGDLSGSYPNPSVTNAANVANTGAVTTNANYYPCLLAANTTGNQPCNTTPNILINPSVPSIIAASGNGLRIQAAGSHILLLGAGGDWLFVNPNGDVSVNGGSFYPVTNNTGSVGAAAHDWQNVFTQNIPQVNDIASTYYVTSNFTTAANTSLQTITGLTWTLIASTAQKVPFRCHLAYSQATAAVAVAFGIQAATIAPNQIFATGDQHTSATAVTAGVLANLTTTTATNIVAATPAATATNNVVTLDGEIDNPSNVSANVINIMVSTATAGDVVTVLQGSFCRIN